MSAIIRTCIKQYISQNVTLIGLPPPDVFWDRLNGGDGQVEVLLGQVQHFDVQRVDLDGLLPLLLRRLVLELDTEVKKVDRG